MAEYEDTPEEIHQQVREEKEQQTKKKPSFLDELSTNQKILLGAVIVLILYNAYVKGYQVKNSLMTLVIAGIVIYFILRGKDEGPLYMDEQALKIELYRRLRYKQLHPLGNHFELPMGDICIDAPTKERWLDARPWKRVIGFFIKDRMSNHKDFWTAVVDIRSGNILDLRHKYFDGREAPDLKWIKSPAVMEEERYTRTLGKGRYRK